MLKLSATLLDQQIISLRTGGAVATSESAIINPNNLKIEGFYVVDQFSKQRLILLTQDIRDITAQGLLIDDHSVLTEPDELIRLQQIIEINFTLIHKPVQTVKKEKVGKINDFAADSQTMYIQKMYVGQSLLKSFTTGQLSIDRSEIVEVTNKRVVIKELQKPTRSAVRLPAPAV